MNNVVLYRECPICGNTMGTVVRKINMYLPDGNPLPRDYQVVCCVNCGFAFANVKATQENYNDYYRNYNMYSENEEIKANLWMRKVHQERINLLVDSIPQKAKILDVGCGGGEFLCFLKENGYQNIYGLDPSKKSIDKLKENGIEGIWSNIFDEVNDNLRGKFDLVVSTAVIEHIYELNTYIEQLKKYMKDDGYLLLDAPAVEGFSQYIYPVANYFNHEHINYFSIQSLDNLLDKHEMRRINPMAYFVIGENEQEKEMTLLALYHKGVQQGLIKDINSLKSIELYNNIVKDNISDTLKKVLQKKNKIIIWGSGSYAMQIIAKNPELLEYIDYFVDNNTIKQSMKICDRNVYSPVHILKETNAIILICSLKNSEDIKKQLMQLKTNLEFYIL